MTETRVGFDRRKFSAFLAGFGVAGTALPKLLWAEAEATGGVSKEALIGAEQIAGLEFTDDERELMLSGLEELREDYERLREVPLDNSVSPALHFDPGAAGDGAPERTADPACQPSAS